MESFSTVTVRHAAVMANVSFFLFFCCIVLFMHHDEPRCASVHGAINWKLDCSDGNWRARGGTQPWTTKETSRYITSTILSFNSFIVLCNSTFLHIVLQPCCQYSDTIDEWGLVPRSLMTSTLELQCDLHLDNMCIYRTFCGFNSISLHFLAPFIQWFWKPPAATLQKQQIWSFRHIL